MKTPDYKYIESKAEEAYDVISKLTFETYNKDKKGTELISKACTAIAILYRYSREKKDEISSGSNIDFLSEENNESKDT